MTNYQELSRFKLKNIKLNKLKSPVKNKTGAILRINKKNLKMKNYHMNYFQQQDKQLK